MTRRWHQYWRIDEAVTGISCRQLQVRFDLAQCIYVVSELCFLVTSPKHLTHFPSRMLPVRSTSADQQYFINMILKLNKFLWQYSCGSLGRERVWWLTCHLLEWVAVRHVSCTTQIHSFMKAARTTVSVRSTVTRLRYCAVPGLYVAIFCFVFLILYLLLIRFTSSNLCYISKAMMKHQTKIRLKIGSPMI